jgi:magnesium chelatase family protein
MIAVAGHHHLHLVGPPGLGKTSLATAASALLPPLTYSEEIELLSIYEAAHEPRIDHRPLRLPNSHITLSQLFGSSQRLTPGEASLAHTGILFVDELNHASTEVLQGLRKILDQKKVVLSNATGSTEFPADFLLLAASNPCPCGYWGTQVRACKCTQSQRVNFIKKLSGALLDRIDMQLKVNTTTHATDEKLSTLTANQARQYILTAQEKQRLRFKNTSLRYNADLTLENYPKFISMNIAADMLLNRSALKYSLSYRAIEKTIGVAKTICDLSQEQEITVQHIKEALSYRFEQNWEGINM